MNRFLLGLFLALALVVGPPAATSAGVDVPDRFCYNWGFLNNTSVDADGLQARLASIQVIGEVYTGSWNPFGDPLPGSGYNPKTDSYLLAFSGGPAYTGDLVYLGFCTDAAMGRTSSATSAPLIWQMGGAQATPAPLFLGVRWTWVGLNSVQIQIFNDTPVAMTLLTANLLDPGEALPLGDLTGEITAGLPLLQELLAEPLALPAGSMAAFSYPISASAATASGNAAVATWLSDQPLVLEAVAVADDDPGNQTSLIAQARAPLRYYLPVLLRSQ